MSQIIRGFYTVTLWTAALLATGCNRPAPQSEPAPAPSPGGAKVKVDVPGVKINIGDKKVDVNVPNRDN